MEGTEMVSFQMISMAGTTRSMLMEAMQLAKAGKIDEANEKVKESNETMIQAHKEHFELIQKEANGESTEFSLLLMHAEDQLMAAAQFKDIVTEMIQLYAFVTEKLA